MKYMQRLCFLFTAILFNCLSLHASSITAYDNQTVYETFNHVFRNVEIAQGFVRLNNGFTVMPGACASMDVLFSVSGGLDLRETGTFQLLKDLKFESNVTLTTGGNINGRHNKIILDGDFVVPAGKVLHFNGDTIIDANDHEIIVGENAQMFVDTNITLTIINAVLKSTRNAFTCPPLRLGAHTSKLVLGNVVFAPCGDFWFEQGQLFIHNDVIITGTSAFVYHSPKPSFITPNSCLYVDHNVTFSVAPATFTDAPYTLKNTYTDCNFIKMTDQTSSLYLKGCTLLTTNTGLRLTSGKILVDSKLSCQSNTDITVNSLTQVLASRLGTHVFSWSPDGRFFATGNDNDIRVYQFNGTTATLLTTKTCGASIKSVSWSPDGKFLASGSLENGHEVQVYRFDGTSLTLWAEATYNQIISEVRWNPDGKFLAAGRYRVISATDSIIYRFNGTSLSVVQLIPYNAHSLDWSPDGQYLAFGRQPSSAEEIAIYHFDGTTFTLWTEASYGSTVYAVRWSPDGRFLAAGGNSPTDRYELHIYRFDGSSLMLCSHIAWGTDSTIHSIDWSPDGKYLTVSGTGSRDENLLKIYSFDGSLISEVASETLPGSSEPVYPAAWGRDGKFIAVLEDSDPITIIFNVNYGTQTIPQALSGSIVFGDRNKGEEYDAHIVLQPGASINLDGAMLYDNGDGINTDIS